MHLTIKKTDLFSYISTGATSTEEYRDVYKNIRGLSNIEYPSMEDLFIAEQIEKIEKSLEK